MSNPYVTIIVPFLNASSTLDKCIQSIINQSRKDWELILVDDGSTDTSSETCHKYELSDPRIILLTREHEGVAAARNAAIEIAKGEKLCFIDADDTVESNYLDVLCSHPESDMVVCGYFVDRYDKDGTLTSSESHCPKELTITCQHERYLLEEAFMSGVMHINCNKLFYMSIIKKHNIRYKNYPVNEDFIFIMEYLSHSASIAFNHHAVYHWIRIAGIDTAVKSLPGNLLEIYEESHNALEIYFNDIILASKIMYRTYDLMIYKYFQLYDEKKISKDSLKALLNRLHKNPLVIRSFDSYSPSAPIERLLYFFNKNGCFWISRNILALIKLLH